MFNHILSIHKLIQKRLIADFITDFSIQVSKSDLLVFFYPTSTKYDFVTSTNVNVSKSDLICSTVSELPVEVLTSYE